MMGAYLGAVNLPSQEDTVEPDIRAIARRAALERTLYMNKMIDEALARAANALRALRGAPCR